MIKSYLKIAGRNFSKNKTFSVINIAGLAIGLACFLLIALYVLDELSYDRFNDKADRIYRINADLRFGGADAHMPLTADPMGAMLKKDYPQVEEFARIYNANGAKLIKKGNGYINEPNVTHADSTLFNIFTLPAVSGDTKTALNEPNTVVITESTSKKYFGTESAIGKTIETNDNNKTLYKVTAVIRDIPHNSHFHFDFIFSMKNADYNWGQFISHNFHTYLLLRKGTDYREFEKNFKQYIERYVLPQAKQFMQIKDMDEFEKAGNKLVYSLIPVTRIHLYSDRQFELSSGGNIQYVYIFSAVALFILIIACINFMNLTTARSASRAREVGIRKVLGSERRELIAQFLVESTLMTILSFLIAFAIASLSLGTFNDIASKSMSMKGLFSPLIFPWLLALPFLVGLIAGSYPAFFLSSFRPIEVLKGRLKLGGKSSGLRSLLVVFQFFTSILLIIGTIVIYRQLNYIQTKNLGFNKNQVMIINDAYVLGKNVEAFKNELLQTPGVSSGTLSGYLPVSSSRSDDTYSTSPVMDAKNGFDMQNWSIDYDYMKTLGMQMEKGRNFSREFGSDSSAVIINETTAKNLGYENPLGHEIYSSIGSSTKQTIAHTIIGVVKNFHFESLKQTIGSLGLFLRKSTGLASFRINAADISGITKQAEKKWKVMAPGMPFSYRFLDDSFDDMYRGEQRVGKIALIFASLAILIACLGLFGLVTFIAEQRTKEIGIRKVLGASVQGIVQLLSKDFMKLVILSFVIAAPLAWWAMNKWLDNFAYRISIQWWIFVMAGMAALVIAMVTVSFQAIKAAFMNPAKSLGTEG